MYRSETTGATNLGSKTVSTIWTYVDLEALVLLVVSPIQWESRIDREEDQTALALPMISADTNAAECAKQTIDILVRRSIARQVSCVTSTIPSRMYLR